jgi:hypothetical protein
VNVTYGLLADEYLSGLGVGGDSGGDVDGHALDVAVLKDHRTYLDPDVRWRQTLDWDLGDDHRARRPARVLPGASRSSRSRW